MTLIRAALDAVPALSRDVAALARETGHGDLADILLAEAERSSGGEAVVVAAGAQKRGKSRLLNALLATPDLLPVSADIATDTHVALRYGTTPSASVLRHGNPPTREFVKSADLAQYASVWGDPAHRRDVASVDVVLDRPLLAGLRLIDTPGVDSLTVGHRHATVAAMEGADALLYAVSAQDQPVLRHELEFLGEAAARVDDVAIVLTKTDDSVSAAALLAENQQRLATFLDTGAVSPGATRKLRTIPWIGVSAKLGEAAHSLAVQGRAEVAQRRRERSGLDNLERHLRTVAVDVHTRRARRALGVADDVLASVAATVQDRVAAHGSDDDARRAREAELESEQDRIAEQRRDHQQFTFDNQHLIRTTNKALRHRLAAVRVDYQRTIGDLRSGAALDAFVRELPESIERSLRAVWTELAPQVERDARETVRVHLGRLGAATTALVPLATPSVRVEAPRPSVSGRRPHLVTDGLPSLMMAGSVTSVLVATTGIAGILLLPAAAVGGAVGAVVLVARRRLAALERTRDAVASATSQALAEAGEDLIIELDHALQAWGAQADGAVADFLARTEADLSERRNELQRAAAQEEAARRHAAAAAAQLLARIDGLRTRLVPLADAVGADIARGTR